MATIFEKIVSGEVPSYKITDNDNFLAILDLHPRSKGHTLIITKKQYNWVWDVPNFGEFCEFAKKVSLAIQKSLQPELISMYTYGLEVPHAHIHLIPKYPTEPEIERDKNLQLTPEEMQGIADKIKSALIN